MMVGYSMFLLFENGGKENHCPWKNVQCLCEVFLEMDAVLYEGRMRKVKFSQNSFSTCFMYYKLMLILLTAVSRVQKNNLHQTVSGPFDYLDPHIFLWISPQGSIRHSWRGPTWFHCGWAWGLHLFWGRVDIWAGRAERRSDTASSPGVPSGCHNMPATGRKRDMGGKERESDERRWCGEHLLLSFFKTIHSFALLPRVDIDEKISAKCIHKVC